MDPLGFGLEQFGPTGRWRDHDGDGPIDASGRLIDGTAFRGAFTKALPGDGYKVLVSLLEGSPSADGNYPEGSADAATAVFVAGELGKDLADAFGDKDVFILQ